MTKQRQFGFSLLESVLATAVIMIGIVSIISLAIVSLVGGEVTSDEFMAVNFAREAMESIRVQRDSNWLAMDAGLTAAWNDNLYELSGTTYDYSGIVTMGIGGSTRFSFLPNSFGDTCVGASSTVYDCTSIWYESSRTRYIQSTDITFVPASYEETKFQRLVMLYPICRDSSSGLEQIISGTGNCAGLGATWSQVGIDAIVQMHWPERTDYRTYTIEEHLYDWKY